MLNLRMPARIKHALRRAAEDDDRSLSALALKIIKSWLQSRRYLARRSLSRSLTRSRVVGAKRSG